MDQSVLEPDEDDHVPGRAVRIPDACGRRVDVGRADDLNQREVRRHRPPILCAVDVRFADCVGQPVRVRVVIQDGEHVVDAPRPFSCLGHLVDEFRVEHRPHRRPVLAIDCIEPAAKECLGLLDQPTRLRIRVPRVRLSS
jgi:hypothetical protein